MNKIVSEIEKLKKEKNAIILTHYYTLPEVQDIADFLGDSLALSRMARDTDAHVILFCGVHFMAETASIISPNKKVLIPALGAGCTLADSITGKDIKKWREKNPGGLVVSYVNTSADVKANSDYCCTSSNAIKVVASLPKDTKILFTPDINLGAYINKVSGRNMDVWNGNCFVHNRYTKQLVMDACAQYPEADILIHPESACSHDDEILNNPRCFIYSTLGIINHAKASPKKQFVIVTEPETLHILKKQNPEKEFIALLPEVKCHYMKKASLAGVLNALKNEEFEVKVGEEVQKQAILPIDRMIAIG